MTAPRALRFSVPGLAALVVLALAALLIAGEYEYRKPPRSTAKSTVFVTRVFPADPSAVDSAVDDFETAMGLAQVQRAVAAQTGAPISALASSLKFNRVGSSSAVEVSFTSQSAAQARTVVTTASRDALTTLAQQQLDGAREAVAAAQPAANSALQAVVSFEQQLGVGDFTSEYQARQQALLNLENALASATPSQIASLNARIISATAAVNQLAVVQPRYQELQDQLTQAQTQLSTATGALIDAEGRMAAAGSPTIVTTAAVTSDSRLVPAVRAGVIAAVLVLLLGLGVAFLASRAGRDSVPPEDVVAGEAPLVPGAPRERHARV